MTGTGESLTVIPTEIVASSELDPRGPRAIEREFRSLLEGGARLRCAGEAKDDPESLLTLGYSPRYKLSLFDTTIYLANVRQNPDLRFFVAYVVQRRTPRSRADIFPRIFYKDVSLIWRCGSHLMLDAEEMWIGKGDVTIELVGDYDFVRSEESTTDLPFELQTALESANRKIRRVQQDIAGLALVLRRAPYDRIHPYEDFSKPRRIAAAEPRNLIHRGKRVVWFQKAGDPESLRFARGFEPDFDEGVLEEVEFSSGMYGGRGQRFRILSTNRRIQYLFFAAPTHTWIIPPQALTTELSSYGARTIDVLVDEDAFVPGYEYHFMDDTLDPPELHSQIPEGFAGEPHPDDDSRADASAWIERLPVIQEFRRKVLGQ